MDDQFVVSSAIIVSECCEKHAREWMKQALNTLDESIEVDIVEEIARSHFSMQQLIPYKLAMRQLLWQGMEVGYSMISLTCAMCWMWPKWPKDKFRMPQYRNHNIWSRKITPMSNKTRNGEFSFLGTKQYRLRYKDTRQWFVKITQKAGFLAKMAKHRINKHARGTKQQVHIYQTDADSRHQNRH